MKRGVYSCARGCKQKKKRERVPFAYCPLSSPSSQSLTLSQSLSLSLSYTRAPVCLHNISSNLTKLRIGFLASVEEGLFRMDTKKCLCESKQINRHSYVHCRACDCYFFSLDQPTKWREVTPWVHPRKDFG